MSPSKLEIGEKVFVHQEPQLKLDTLFNPSQFTIVEKNGNTVTLDWAERLSTGVQNVFVFSNIWWIKN